MNDIVVNQNPFAAPQEIAPATVSVVAKAEIEREVAMIQTAATIAQARPRDKKAAWDGIMRECERVALAAEAVYAFPRGNEIVSDASIHLIRCIARHWGNIHTSVRILAQTETESQVRALAWDLEANAPYFLDFRAPHVREAGGKTYPLTAPRDIYEAVMNVGQRRLRSCIEALLPSQVIEDAKLACDKTLAKLGPPDALLANMLTRMKALGVGQKHLEDRLGRPLTKNGKINVNVRAIVNFDRIAKSIEDGVGTPAGFFPGWEPLPSRPTGTQTVARTAAAKGDLWPKMAKRQDGTICWFGRGNEIFDPLKHESDVHGRPLVAEDGTLVGKVGAPARQRTEPEAAPYSMSGESAQVDPEALIGEIQECRTVAALQDIRLRVAAFPVRHAECWNVRHAFDEKLIELTLHHAEGWPQPLLMADGRRIQIDKEGTIWDVAVHAKDAAGSPSMRQDGTFRARRGSGAKTAPQAYVEAPNAPDAPDAPDAPNAWAPNKSNRPAGNPRQPSAPAAETKPEPERPPKSSPTSGAGMYLGPKAEQIRAMIEECQVGDDDRWNTIEDLLKDFPATDPEKEGLLARMVERRPF